MLVTCKQLAVGITVVAVVTVYVTELVFPLIPCALALGMLFCMQRELKQKGKLR